jgi:hypothetical protein
MPVKSEVSRWSQLLDPLVDRANGGDPQALQQLREILDDNPDLWKAAGDLGAIAMERMLVLVAEGNALTTESIRRWLQQMRIDLGGTKATGVEALLVEQVLLSWLQSRRLALLSAASKPGSVQQAACNVRKLDSADRRYHTALRALDNHRKLFPESAGTSPALPRIAQ